MEHIILNDQEIAHKTKRIAYQIYETFCDEEEVILAGISKNGFVFATKIAVELAAISPLKVVLCEVFINKQDPKAAITTSLPTESFEDKGLVLIDDVLHSGTTLIYGVKYFLEFNLRKFKTAVLVDRNHKKYPVKADFKGLSLSTSLNEHIDVVFEAANSYVTLS